MIYYLGGSHLERYLAILLLNTHLHARTVQVLPLFQIEHIHNFQNRNPPMNTAAQFRSQYAAPSAATGTPLALLLSHAMVKAKSKLKMDITLIKKLIVNFIEDSAKRRGNRTSIIGIIVRVSVLHTVPIN